MVWSMSFSDACSGMGFSSSISQRKSNCSPRTSPSRAPNNRVFTVVVLSSKTAMPDVSTPSASSISKTARPGPSSPTTPCNWLDRPSESRPRATCAAAPTSSSLEISFNTGTGALELRLFAKPWI